MAWSSLECSCKAAVGQEVASTTGACERGRVGDVAWRWLEAHTLVIEVVLKSSSESLISLPKTRCWVVRGAEGRVPETACVMRVHEVMRCGHVQEWPPRQRVHGGWACPCAKPRAVG
eukprot:scaffold32867_cov40-Phaeocystis_antarctica.AAC.1